MINATALLIIAACVLVLLVLHRVDEAGTRVAGAVTGATLARLQVTPAEFKENLEGLDDRLKEISDRLQSANLQADPALLRQLTQLNTNLEGLRQAADGIRAAGPDITAAAFEQAGEVLTNSLYTLRGCGVPTNVVIPEDGEPPSAAQAS
ncbi:hypothetical protein E1180_19085 [Roseibium denhamense]|nr:hypothetical protein [Roseibium denhamense]